MKLRIRGNSLRLRLTQGEVEKIRTAHSVEEKVEFPDGNNFIYKLSSGSAEDLSASFSNGLMEIVISAASAQNWCNSAEVGIYGNSGKIQISIEKDFQCLTPRQGEDDKDTFPHPQEKC